MRVRIGFDKLEPQILPDMGIKVRFLDEAPAVANSSQGPRVRVPTVAVQRSGGEAYVWVVNDGTVERRAITTGAENDGQTEVLAGVHAGEELVAPIVEGLEDGGKVKLKESNS